MANNEFWFNKRVCGLSKPGQDKLKRMEGIGREDVLRRLGDEEKKSYHYLKTLNAIKQYNTPDFFRHIENPKKFYHTLLEFTNTNNINTSVAKSIIPSLLRYVQTGHMRPLLLVGEPGCGKTTAIKKFAENALGLPTIARDVTQIASSHGVTGEDGSYKEADVGILAQAQIENRSILHVFIFEEIDKAVQTSSVAPIDKSLLSVCDANNTNVQDNYLSVPLVGIEHCPIFFSANDLSLVNPILADRCTVIQFPNPPVSLIQSIMLEYVKKELESPLYNQFVKFDFRLMNASIDRSVALNVISLRKHQQVMESVLNSAFAIAMSQEEDDPIEVDEKMFREAEDGILLTKSRMIGF